MSLTQALNHIYSLACLIAALCGELLADPEVSGLLPHRWGHAIAAAAILALWVKNHKNLFINPDGTNAQAPYIPPDPKRGG